MVSALLYTDVEVRRCLRRSQLLDAEAGEPFAQVNAVFEGLALDNTSGETTSKSVTRKPSGRKFFTEDEVHLPSTVGVDDAVLGDFLDGPLLDLNLTTGLHGSRDSGQGTLSDNGGPWAVVVLLRQLSQLLGDLNNVLSAPAVALRVRTGLGFVAESVVGVGQDFIELVLEELRNEGSRERKHKDLFLYVNIV